MSIYTKIELYGFADFYHRFSTTGMTIEEIFQNWSKYVENPRDINDLISVPKRLKEDLGKVIPPATLLWRLANTTCEIHEVSKTNLNGRSNKRLYTGPRQHIAFIGTELGFKPKDFIRILKWDRGRVYAKVKACVNIAKYDAEYRRKLNELLKMFGLEVFKS